jgi:hypothetical protein
LSSIGAVATSASTAATLPSSPNAFAATAA